MLFMIRRLNYINNLFQINNIGFIEHFDLFIIIKIHYYFVFVVFYFLCLENCYSIRDLQMAIHKYPNITIVNVIVWKGIEKSGYKRCYVKASLFIQIYYWFFSLNKTGILMNYYPPPAMF